MKEYLLVPRSEKKVRRLGKAHRGPDEVSPEEFIRTDEMEGSRLVLLLLTLSLSAGKITTKNMS